MQLGGETLHVTGLKNVGYSGGGMAGNQIGFANDTLTRKYQDLA